MTTTSSERRLHPVSIVFEIGRQLSRTLVPLIVLLFATWRQGNNNSLFVIILVAAVVSSAAILSLVRYIRFSYRYDPNELVIRSGLLTRNERSIPYARIQNLDAAQNPLHRLLGVTVVHVQTGGGAEPEASLRVLPMAALREMRLRVLATGRRTPGMTQHPTLNEAEAYLEDDTAAAVPLESGALLDDRSQRTLLALKPRDLILAGFIENRGMVLIFGALALLQETGVTSRMIERLFQTENAAFANVAERWLGGTDVPVALGTVYAAVVLLTIVLFIRLLSTLWAVIRLYDFRLLRVGNELHTEYGLFTRVSATIPLRRVQTVIVKDAILHRLFGRRSVMVETAGGAISESGARARPREPIAPILRLEQLPALLEELHPGLDLADVHWQKVHPRAFGRMLRGSLFWPVALSAVALFFVDQWAIAVFVALLARSFVRARLRARHLAWALTQDSIVVRDGALTRSIRIARFNRVQVVALDRNPFDVRTGMASVRADTAGARGGVVVPYLPEGTAAELREELASRTAATAFTW